MPCVVDRQVEQGYLGRSYRTVTARLSGGTQGWLNSWESKHGTDREALGWRNPPVVG